MSLKEHAEKDDGRSQRQRGNRERRREGIGSAPDEIVPAIAILANEAYPTLRDAVIANPMIAEGALSGPNTADSLHANSESTSKEQFYEPLRRVSRQLS